LSRILQEKRGNVFYNPTQFGESEEWFELKYDEPDKIGTHHRDWAIARTTPMDKDGYFNWGLNNGITMALMTTAKKCAVEVCSEMPYCYGGSRERIHISEVDFVIEEDSPVAEMPPAVPSDRSADRPARSALYTHWLHHSLGMAGCPTPLEK
jgi:acyl-CoA hydrolase